MQNFMVSFNIVFSIFILMAIGYSLKHIGILLPVTVRNMNELVFKLFLPVMIFKNVYDSEVSSVFNIKLLLFAVTAVFMCTVILFIVVPIFVSDNRKRGVLIQSIFRSNFAILGLPVTEALCGPQATGSAAVLVAVIVPIYNFLAVITLEIYNGGKPNFVKIIKGILTNPLIIASVLGIIALFTGFKLPNTIESTVSSLSKVATPVALIMLGASINFKTVGANLRYLIWGISAKLILVPLVFLSAAVFIFDFNGTELSILLALFATPPAVSSFTMAQQMGGDDELAGQLVMFGSALSIISMFVWILITINFSFI